MISRYCYSFTVVALFSLNAYAETHHHDRHEEKIEIKIDADHCHKERSLIGKIGAGSTQLVENNAYLITFLGAGTYLYASVTNPRFRDRELPATLGKAAAIWLGLGLATRNVLRAAMSQCDIPKL